MSTPLPLPEDWQDIQTSLVPAYETSGLWGASPFADELPQDMARGSDPHLAYLTLVFSISGGRDPEALWKAARQTYADDPELFDPKYLAFARPQDLQPRLRHYALSKKPKSEATVWQRIGKALVMRAGGSVRTLLMDHDFDGEALLAMLQKSKTTFPVLSGEQTAPRWIYGLAHFGGQPISPTEILMVHASPGVARALDGLGGDSDLVPVVLFDALDALGRKGCSKRKPRETECPMALECVVSQFCMYGNTDSNT